MDRIEVMAGGKTRTETLMRAAARAAELAEGEEVILLTHDGVRPFVSERMIRESVEAAEETGASVVAVPAVDTMLMSRDGRIVDSVPERKTLYNAQTPQTFRLSKLMRLYEELTDAERDRLTDGASIFTAKGEPVALVMGSGTNIKITYPSDLVIAEAVLGSEGEGFGGKGNKE